ncbi:hypothetical protein CVD23_17240 [Bacillus sp. V33-4]|nr:hypothetical protein CVD23_17240 [Bacillus sp. V33-4]
MTIMKTLLFSLFSLFIILAGCSNEANQPSKQNEAEQKESAKDHQHQESAEEHHHEEQAREHDDEHAAEDHHHSSASISISVPTIVSVNEDVDLSANIQSENQPLTQANVRFELWKENEEKHEFIDASEASNGDYFVNTSFSSPGVYHLKIHVEKGEEIHDHKETTVEVK